MSTGKREEASRSMHLAESRYIRGEWTAPRPFISLVEEAALAAGVQVRWLSDHWIARLQKAGRVCYVHGTCFPLNDSGAAHIAADKVSTFLVLADAGVPAVPHYLVRFPSSGETEGAADRALAQVGPPLVVKPAGEAGGLDVCRAESIEEARLIIDRLATRHLTLAITPFEAILSEHRVVMLDDVPQLFYEKRRRSRAEWRHNLKHGARPVLEESPEERAELTEIAVRAMRAVGGRFMSVDVIRTPRARKVLEINSGVMLDRFATQNSCYRAMATEIYRQAINRCFEHPQPVEGPRAEAGLPVARRSTVCQ